MSRLREPDAMAEDLHVLCPGYAADGVDGGRPIVLDNVVDREGALGTRQSRAGAIVEQPHVVARTAEIFAKFTSTVSIAYEAAVTPMPGATIKGPLWPR